MRQRRFVACPLGKTGKKERQRGKERRKKERKRIRGRKRMRKERVRERRKKKERKGRRPFLFTLCLSLLLDQLRRHPSNVT